MSVGIVGAQTTDVAGPGFEILDLMGDLRRPAAWPAHALTLGLLIRG